MCKNGLKTIFDHFRDKPARVGLEMTQNQKICPICRSRRIKRPRNKTCGNYECRGKYAEDKTKRRLERQKEAEPFIRDCLEASKRQVEDKEICVVCGEFLKASLTTHHFNKEKNPRDVVTLCGSCHRVFDSPNSGLKELKIRRRRYYICNLRCARG